MSSPGVPWPTEPTEGRCNQTRKTPEGVIYCPWIPTIGGRCNRHASPAAKDNNRKRYWAKAKKLRPQGTMTYRYWTNSGQSTGQTSTSFTSGWRS